MKYTTKYRNGFSIVELIIVIGILGILASGSINMFAAMKEQNSYEKFVYTLNHYTQEAKNRAIINEAQWTGSTYSEERAYGVVFQKDSDFQATIKLFQDNNKNGSFDADEVLKTYTEKNVLRIENMIGELSQGSSSASSFDTFTLVFQPDPNPVSTIKSSAGENLRYVEVSFYHPRKNGVQGLRKKYSFDTISKVSQITDNP